MQENEKYITKYVEVIKQKAFFLEKKGLQFEKTNEFIIRYLSKNNYSIVIYYGRYSDSADIYVRFENNLSKPEQFSLGWFKNMKKFESGGKDIFKKSIEKADKLTDILSLLEYLENNFNAVTDIEFCRKTQNKINENFEKGIW